MTDVMRLTKVNGINEMGFVQISDESGNNLFLGREEVGIILGMIDGRIDEFIQNYENHSICKIVKSDTDIIITGNTTMGYGVVQKYVNVLVSIDVMGSLSEFDMDKIGKLKNQ